MEQGELYYLWLYLPDKVKLPPYDRTKERREEIYDLVLTSLQAGEAKLYKAGLHSPNENVTKTHEEVQELNRFTSVVLKYYSREEIDFGLTDEALIQLFIRLFKAAEEVILIGDNTRMGLETDKYRLVTLEGRETWLPGHE
jgi:hypothetical protein